MKIRLSIFVVSLLLLPLLGIYISGGNWSDVAPLTMTERGDAGMVNLPAVLLTTLMMVGYILLINQLNKILTGNKIFATQQRFFIWMSGASVLLVWLICYLNLFVGSWINQTENPILQALLYSPLFALLAPAVLCTRALIAALPGLLKRLSNSLFFTPPAASTLAGIFLLLAAIGLLGGALWTTQLLSLFWCAPLFLLMGLQCLWHESTIFSGLKTGDNGRIVCSAFAGLLVGNFALFAYQNNGGLLSINLNTFFIQAGFVLFAWTCMQLGDVIAENFRGKPRTELFKAKKKFPIPVVVKNK
ncbi:MAG: hypothetical protein ACXW1C_04420 [Gallionella sp.]